MTEDPIIISGLIACFFALALMASAVMNRKRRKPEKKWDWRDNIPYPDDRIGKAEEAELNRASRHAAD